MAENQSCMYTIPNDKEGRSAVMEQETEDDRDMMSKESYRNEAENQDSEVL